MTRYDSDGAPIRPQPQIGKLAVASIVGIIVIILLLVAGAAGCKEYGRYQKRADASNAVKVTHIEIEKAEQAAKITKAQIKRTQAEAQMRREEAFGIKDAQDTIQATLTDRYLIHEAIQAQKAIATSGKNNSLIYVPSGSNGVPLIQDISTGTTRGNQQNVPTDGK